MLDEKGCRAIFSVNDELHQCSNKVGHRGRHRTTFVITAGDMPFTSHVTITWTPWVTS